MGLRLNTGRFNYNIISIEMGYRNISGSNNYRIGGKIDMLTLLTIIVWWVHSTTPTTKTESTGINRMLALPIAE